MNKFIRSLLILMSVSLLSDRAAAQEQGVSSRASTSFTGVIDHVDRELSRIVVNEHAIEYDEKIVVRDRAGKVLTNGLSVLRIGLKVRCVESLREGRSFTTEIWIQDSLESRQKDSRR